MVEIQCPVSRVLSRVDGSNVQQPTPMSLQFGSRKDAVAVEHPCEACGCRWVTDPEIVIPEGTVHCAYCGMWRGSLHRDTKLSEFSDAKSIGESSETISYRWASDGPGWGFGEVLTAAREVVAEQPRQDYLNVCFEILTRPPYEADLYVQEQLQDIDKSENDPKPSKRQ